MLFSTLDATLRVSTPLILCAMAGLFSERSGIVDISLEGKMLFAAFAAGALAAVTGSPWAALGGGIMISVLMGLLHGFACITNRGDQVVSGLAINVLASGLTIVLGIAWFSQGGQTPALAADARFTPIDLPFIDSIAKTPLSDSFWKLLLADTICWFMSHFLLCQSPGGLSTRHALGCACAPLVKIHWQ